MQAFVVEQGPEAHATIARLRERKAVFQGEGFSISAGLDGPTACAVSEGGTLVGMLDDEEVDERDWRRSTTVRRFATVAARDRYLAEQPWQSEARRRGWAAKDEGTGDASRSGGVELRLNAALADSEAIVHADIKDGKGEAIITLRSGNGAQVKRRVGFGPDEWARFEEELRLLEVSRWGEYPANATDGLSWSFMHASRGTPTHARGCNSYPPDGLAIDPTPEFVRMLLAVERLVGVQVWPGSGTRAAVDHIPEKRDRIEHLLLRALRAWAAGFELDSGDPQKIRESAFERALVPYLAELTPTQRQINIKGVLNGWPGVGALDIQLYEDTSAPIWVELKWAKRAGTLFNCLWDAAKLAQALREGSASQGYLVAGAPVAEWGKVTPYRELFRVCCHSDERLVTNHIRDWSGWWQENQETFPLEIPTPIMTLPVGRATFESARGDPWEIRVARVEAPGSDFYLPQAYVSTE